MFKIYDKVIVKKNGREGTILGIVPTRFFRPILADGFKCLVLFHNKARWIKEDKLDLKP